MSEQNGANYDALSDARMRTEVQEVELPGFGDGKPWKPKLKRLSLLGLARSGKIPNELLSAGDGAVPVRHRQDPGPEAGGGNHVPDRRGSAGRSQSLHSWRKQASP